MFRNFIPPVRLLWCGVALGAATPLLRAHDPFEITTSARLRSGVLEVDLTMARSTALAIATNVSEAPTFEPREFGKHHATFVAAAPRLWVITAGGQPLALRTAEVSLGVEADVDFHLTYPAPAASPLRFDARHLAQLPYGYGNVLIVRDAGVTVLGTTLLTKAEPALEIPLAAANLPPVPAKSFRLLLILAAVVALAGTCWLLRRKFAA